MPSLIPSARQAPAPERSSAFRRAMESPCREDLPLRVLDDRGTHGRPVVEVAVRPEVYDLIERGDLRLPDPDVPRILLAHRHDRLEVPEPLRRLADLGAIRPKLVDMVALCWRFERQLR